MNISYLGHAGFMVETKYSIVIMDAWLSPNGAFDGGWFQYPRNHHMASDVIEKLASDHKKSVYVYVSHEHKDHFDLEFLKRLEPFNFKYIIPRFRRTILFDEINEETNKEIILCDDNHKVHLNDSEYIKIYTDDSELNRDSAILFVSEQEKFLNLNDCKIHDRLMKIKQEEGQIDVFTVQFSGASWHPTCYDYPKEEYQKISLKKRLSKFKATAMALTTLEPRAYIPSAGPACFLDPDSIHLNFEKNSMFPRNEHIVEYLEKTLKEKSPQLINMLPGDMTSIRHTIKLHKTAKEIVREEDFESYILDYAQDYKAFFDERKKKLSTVELQDLFYRLKEEFSLKLNNFSSKEKIQNPLYIGFFDEESNYIKVDFQNNKVNLVQKTPKENFYLIKLNTKDVKRVLNGHLTWGDHCLTFRMQLNREPDIYQVLMQGFLIIEKEDLNFFCEKILEIENRDERITVEVGGALYTINRYCPHQGSDMTYAWEEKGRNLVCPRHRWSFDMEDGGKCIMNSACLDAIPLEND